jgi:hypothetical protein
MEQTPPSEVNSHSASKEIPHLLWNKSITVFKQTDIGSYLKPNESSPQPPPPPFPPHPF